MGLLKKITRPISRVLDKIVPNEIKPALPFLAAAAPFFGPTSAFMGTGIRRLLMGGGANLLGQLSQEGNEGEVNPLSLGLATLSAGMTDPGAASYLQGLKTPAGNYKGVVDGVADTVIKRPELTGLQRFKNQALDLGITGVDKLQGLQEAVAADGIMSKAGLKLASIPATQGAMDLGIAETRRFNKQQIIDDALSGLSEGFSNADASDAIRLAMLQYGFGDDEITETIAAAGYADGGRVGLKGGGADFGGIPAAIQNIKEDEEEMITIMTEQGPIQIEKSVYESMPAMFMDTTTSAYGDAAAGRPVPEFKKGGLMDLGGKEMDLRKGGFVPIGKKEKADDVPARLSKNEFVMTADAVRGAGGGNINKGAKRMYETMNKLEARA